MQSVFLKTAQFLDRMSGYDAQNYKKTDGDREELLRARQREHDDVPNEKRLWKKRLIKKKCKSIKSYILIADYLFLFVM